MPTMAFEQLLLDFEASCEWVALWRVYPDVSERDDEAMPACEAMSELFEAFAVERGFDARIVHGDDAADPLAWAHAWVRIGDVNVDWTARQFWNVEPPPPLEVLRTPLVWTGTGADHPGVAFASEW